MTIRCAWPASGYLKGIGDPHRQYTGVIGRFDYLAGDVHGQLEGPVKRAVADLVQHAVSASVSAVLIAVFVVNTQAHGRPLC